MRATNKKPQIKKVRRFTLSVFMLFLLFMAVSRVIYIYVEKADFYAKQGDKRSIKQAKISAPRGVIEDRNGEVLALTTVLVSLGVDLEHLRLKPDMSGAQKIKAQNRIDKFRQDIDFLADKLGKTRSWLLDKTLNQKQKIKFKYLAREITPQLAAELKERKIPALVYERKFKRFYPKVKIGASLLGFADFKEQGKAGIEASFNEHLSGTDGKAWVRRDHLGNVIDYISMERPVQKGRALQLSIDFKIQEITYLALAEAFKQHQAHKAAAVVLNAKTGEILAVESLPSFNPNDTRQRTSKGTRNVAIQDLYEPGSTMKPFTVLAALNAGVIDKDQSIHIGNGKLKVANATYRDSAKIESKNIDLATLLKKSSNVGAIKLGFMLETEKHRDFLHKLGFGQELQIGLNSAVKGILREADKITKVDHASMSFGHGLNTSLLQLARSYLVLANSGKISRLTVLKKTSPVKFKTISSAENANHVLDLLKQVVSKDGTAQQAAVEGFSVAGKTGTSHKFVNGRYAEKKYVGFFAGIVPADNPQLVIAVLIDEPKGKKYFGGQTAAPVFAKIATDTLAYLGVKPDKQSSGKALIALKTGADL